MNSKLDKANVQDILELSMMQKGMLFHHLKEADNNLYTVQVTLDLEGAVQLNVLGQAFARVQEKNEALRSVFRWQTTEKALQIILKECPLKIAFYDWSLPKGNELETAIQA